MGSDKNYLCLEPAAGADPDALESRLASADPFGVWSDQHGDTVVVAGYGRDTDPAIEQLHAVADDVQRAFLLHIADTAMTGIGHVYERTDDGLVECESITGRERYGIDVVDYVKREYGIDGPR